MTFGRLLLRMRKCRLLRMRTRRVRTLTPPIIHRCTRTQAKKAAEAICDSVHPSPKQHDDGYVYTYTLGPVHSKLISLSHGCSWLKTLHTFGGVLVFFCGAFVYTSLMVLVGQLYINNFALNSRCFEDQCSPVACKPCMGYFV